VLAAKTVSGLAAGRAPARTAARVAATLLTGKLLANPLLMRARLAHALLAHALLAETVLVRPARTDWARTESAQRHITKGRPRLHRHALAETLLTLACLPAHRVAGGLGRLVLLGCRDLLAGPAAEIRGWPATRLVAVPGLTLGDHRHRLYLCRWLELRALGLGGDRRCVQPLARRFDRRVRAAGLAGPGQLAVTGRVQLRLGACDEVNIRAEVRA
jgi:hypothetical protein